MDMHESPIHSLMLQVEGWRRNAKGLRDGVAGAPDTDLNANGVKMTAQMMDQICDGLDSTIGLLQAKYKEPDPD